MVSYRPKILEKKMNSAPYNWQKFPSVVGIAPFGRYVFRAVGGACWQSGRDTARQVGPSVAEGWLAVQHLMGQYP